MKVLLLIVLFSPGAELLAESRQLGQMLDCLIDSGASPAQCHQILDWARHRSVPAGPAFQAERARLDAFEHWLSN
ncbi:MAG: hypothetical protein KC910_27290, partial [Candidatus Eremiobacteraeota bacterium]|nr:hypothetical protein [Candidatus Eremiobacteraeota bacterium]